ncbi:uncharacterized protein LOC129353168 [Poeciliopsis prolifica]|uniref:uncharacterized protein LOC129353168 n=1 Tax=Poeciliopsis prolifica TaxID=188132 RepID=UPI00241418BA|nr:uncharacterized protein LOC129353168 [Poeciliopsis prolifica]
MAAWLLRSSRLGALKFDSWGTLRRQPPGLFCSEAKESVKPVKNTKDPDKTGEDERAAMWTYKTTVAFPVKLLEPGVLPNFLGVTKEPVRFTATSEKTAASVTASTKSAGEKSPTVTASSDLYQSQEEVSQILAHDTLPVYVPAEEASVEALCKGSVPEDIPSLAVTIDDVVKPTTVSSKLGNSAAEELSSSSSSESDSDSDSDSESFPEDENLETQTRSFSLELQLPSHQEQREMKEFTVSGVTKGLPNAEEAEDQSVVEASKDNLQVFDILTATKSAAELTSSAFSTHTAPTDTLCEAPAVLVEQHEAPEKAQSNSPLKAADVLMELEDGFVDAGEESWEKASTIGPVQSKTVSAEVVADHPAEVGTSVETEDSARALVEASGEELYEETSAEQPEESAAVPPEPEKSFDNSTYKNYQHHSYTSYTFADLDVEMAKYRLPQPSSGKLSPRH